MNEDGHWPERGCEGQGGISQHYGLVPRLLHRPHQKYSDLSRIGKKGDM